jgi:adenosylhomocysteine nucleosidase
MRCSERLSGSRQMAMPRIAIIAALEREVSGLIRRSKRVQHNYAGRAFIFYELDDTVVIAGGIGVEAARRAAEAAIGLYGVTVAHSVGFAGALDSGLSLGEVFTPAVVIDARDGSRTQLENGNGVLLTQTSVADAKQKATLGRAYGAQAVDMEAAGVAAACQAHEIEFRATKAISDDFDFEMPETGRFIDSQGRFQTARFALYAAMRPWLWRRVLALSRNSSRAAKSLVKYLKNSLEAGRTSTVEAKTI